MTGLGLYVHFPWCVRKCPYCDFNSHPLRSTLDEAGYMAALRADAGAALADLDPGAIETIFCGGGTPSLFSPGAFEDLLAFVAPWLAETVEVTMEANPGTAEHHDLSRYRKAGINRLSLGAQSFDPAQLSRLGRIHAAQDTVRVFEQARAARFDNINLDLMYGLPGQTAPEALADLDRAIELGPEHLSWYQLTIEPKTEFARRPPILATDDEVAIMEREGWARLKDAGFERYEISAYAQTGRRCRHNLNYWTFGDYAGLGAGAHGKRSHRSGGELQVVRTRKAPQPRLYLNSPTHTERVTVPQEERIFEFMMNALRLANGVDFRVFEPRTGLDPDVLMPTWQSLVEQGLVRPDRIATTEFGYRHLDGVLQRFLT